MEGDRYQGLRKISEVLRIFAWVLLVLCGVGFLVGLGLIMRKPEVGGVVCLVAVIYGILGFLYLYTISQLILVILDIETNTRVAAGRKETETAG